MEQFEQFASDHAITLTATAIPTRTGRGRDSEWDKTASHFHLVLIIGEGAKARTLWAGEYSQGIGHAEAWAKKNKGRFAGLSVGHGWPMSDALANGPGRGKVFRQDSDYWRHIRQRYRKAVSKADQKIITPAEVLLSLQMDIAACDQPFPDWASDLGYSDDSITAKEIWEECNDTRRQLQSVMTRAQFDAFLDLEE